MNSAVFYDTQAQPFLFPDSRLELFKWIEQLNITDIRQWLGNILNTRLGQLADILPDAEHLNLAGKLSLPEFQILAGQPAPGLSAAALNTERFASELFDNFADFWCEYEIYRIKSRYKNNSSFYSYTISYDENNYNSLIISDISLSKSKYFILHEDFPMRLSDAVLMLNLHSCVQEKLWYEILFSLELSTYGKHFIMWTNATTGIIPVIVSTARIQTEYDYHEWLYFSSYFQSTSWIPKNNIECKNFLTNITKNLSRNSFNITNIKTLDRVLFNSLKHQKKICEIIRLTVSGNMLNRLYILYLAQKKLLFLLQKNNIDIAFVIFTHKLAAAFYNKLGSEYFLCTGINDTDKNPTYKGLWFVNMLGKQFNQYSYKRYREVYFLLKKHQKPASRQGLIDE